MNYGNLDVAKRFMVKDHYETHKREITFEYPEFMFGTVHQIVTVPHDIYRTKNGEPVMVQMKVDTDSKLRFDYENKYIVSL